MKLLYLASALAIVTALAHSYLSERLFLQPLRADSGAGAFARVEAKRLAVAMFHLPSLCWAGMAISMLLLEPSNGGYRQTLQIYAGIFAISGLGNFWAVGRPHPGGVMLLLTSALILSQLHI